jgi:hypothetical protein
MNTTEKGDIFEDRVYNLLLEQLTAEKLFISGRKSMLFKKHEYFSKDRDKKIIFDLVIECYRDGADKPNFIVLIECKDYTKPISIEKLEAFYAKKDQIARANSKCLFVTTNSLQEGAYNYATNLGIGVIRILDDDSLNWLIERTTKYLTTTTSNTTSINVFNALTDEYFVSTNNNFYAYYNLKPFTSLLSLLEIIFSEDNE